MRHKVLKRDLREGNVIPIFLDWKTQENFRGNAVLLERLEDKEPPLEIREYEFKEIGDKYLRRRKKEKVSVLYAYQRWIIKFTTGDDKGFKTTVNIAYFSRTNYTKYKL